MAQRYPLLSAMWKYLPINYTWPEQWASYTAETPVFSALLQLQSCPLALAWVGPALALLSLPLVIPEGSHTHILTHQDMASESQLFVCVTSLHKGIKLQSTVSKPVATHCRNTGFHCYMINKAQDHPDTTYLVPQCQKITPLTHPLSVLTTACVEYYTGEPAVNEIVCPGNHLAALCCFKWSPSPVT